MFLDLTTSHDMQGALPLENRPTKDIENLVAHMLKAYYILLHKWNILKSGVLISEKSQLVLLEINKNFGRNQILK